METEIRDRDPATRRPIGSGRDADATDRRKTKRHLIAELRAARAEVTALHNALHVALAVQAPTQTVGARGGTDALRQVIAFPSRSRGLVGRAASGLSPAERDEARAYANLRRQLEFTRTMTESLSEGVVALDHAGLLTYMNRAAHTMLGWRSGELLGRRIHDCAHYQYADGTPRAPGDCPILGVLETRETIQVEDDVFTRKDGVVIPVTYVAAPIISDGGLAGAVVVFQDVTEQRRLEAATRQSERRAAARARQLDALFSTLDDPVIIYDHVGGIVDNNPAAHAMFAFADDAGYRSLPLAERIQHITALGPDDLPLVTGDLPLWRVLGGETISRRHAIPITLRIPGGARQRIAFSGAPLRDADGQIDGAVCVFRVLQTRHRRAPRNSGVSSSTQTPGHSAS